MSKQPPQPTVTPGLDTTQRMEAASMTLTVFAKTHVGLVRANNEDAFLVADLSGGTSMRAMASTVSLVIKDRGILFAVSDGMGGKQAGDVASDLALQALQTDMATTAAATAEAALRGSVESANLRVFQAAHAAGTHGMGATLTATLFHGAHVYIAEIGDSRAYLLRHGRLVQLTRDQSLVQRLLDAGAITPEQAEASQFKNVILQAMGARTDVVVAMNRLTLRRKDRFLLCSDGLTGKVTDAELLVALSSPAVESACEELVSLALSRGGDDNITVIVADLDGDGVPALTDPDRVSLASLVA